MSDFWLVGTIAEVNRITPQAVIEAVIKSGAQVHRVTRRGMLASKPLCRAGVTDLWKFGIVSNLAWGEDVHAPTAGITAEAVERAGLKAPIPRSRPSGRASISQEFSGLSPRAETSYLNIIGALLEVISNGIPDPESPGTKIGPLPGFKSEAKLIAAIASHYAGYGGLSQSNLQRKLPEAKRSLASS